MNYITQQLLIPHVVSERPQRNGQEWQQSSQQAQAPLAEPHPSFTHSACQVMCCLRQHPEPIWSTHSTWPITFPLLRLTKRDILKTVHSKKHEVTKSALCKANRGGGHCRQLMAKRLVCTLLSCWRIPWVISLVFSSLLPYCSLGKLGQNTCLV